MGAGGTLYGIKMVFRGDCSQSACGPGPVLEVGSLMSERGRGGGSAYCKWDNPTATMGCRERHAAPPGAAHQQH